MPRAELNFNLIAEILKIIFIINNIPMPRCAAVKTEKKFKHVTLNTKISLSIQ